MTQNTTTPQYIEVKLK